jgi:hypothetical protein
MNVTIGKKLKPLALLIHGVHGIGKTNFPTEAPLPIFIGSEENDEIECARLGKIETWKDLQEQLTWLRDAEHDFKTLVIDCIDTLEQVCQKDILKGQNGKSMATAFGGYGKAYEKMADMFLEIRDDFLVPIREKRGMNVVLLAHSEKNKHEDPMTNTSYDNYSTAIHKKIKPIFEDWVSAILFINYSLFKSTRESDGKETLQSIDGERTIYCEERPSHIAKNRYNLPEEVPYKKTGAWKELTGHIRDFFAKGAPATTTVTAPTPTPAKEAPKAPVKPKEKAPLPSANEIDAELARRTSGPEPKAPSLADESVEIARIKAEIDRHFEKMPDEVKERITASVKRAGDNHEELLRILKKMQGALK